MGRRVHETEDEARDARRLQNREAQRRYRERRKRQGNTTSSIGTNRPRAKKHTKRRPVEQAPKDVENVESEWNLPDDPGARLMLERQLIRIMGDLESVARTLQSTADPSLSEYLTDRRLSIQRAIEILQDVLPDRSDSAEASFGGETTNSAADSTHHLPVQHNAVPDCRPCSESPSKVSEPSSGIRSLRALVHQLNLLGSIGSGYTVDNRTVRMSRITPDCQIEIWTSRERVLRMGSMLCHVGSSGAQGEANVVLLKLPESAC
ncbi:hypothetical protein PSPO01_16580 [Paraphaeosphaeria sporulosa]